jgi:hypothetical protein
MGRIGIVELTLTELFAYAEEAAQRGRESRSERVLHLWLGPEKRAARGRGDSFIMPDSMMIMVYLDQQDRVVFIEIERKARAPLIGEFTLRFPWWCVYEFISRAQAKTCPAFVRIDEGDAVLTRVFASVFGAVAIGLGPMGKAIWMELPSCPRRAGGAGYRDHTPGYD